MPQQIYKKRHRTSREEVQPIEGPVEAVEQAKIADNLRESAEAVRTADELISKINKLIESIGTVCIASS